MRLINLVSKSISYASQFVIPEEFSFPENLGVFLTVITHI